MSLEKPIIAKTLRTIDLLEQFGNKLVFPHSKKITGNLFELRVRGMQEIRVIYAFHNDAAIILRAFKKKTMRIPKREIEVAEQRLKMVANL